jgi:porin
MRHAMVGAAVVTSLLLGWAGSALGQDAPAGPVLTAEGTPQKEEPKKEAPKTTPPKKEEPKKPPTPAPAPTSTAPSTPGKSWLLWDKATGDWGGMRTKWEDKGIFIGARLTDDYTHVFQGGADSHEEHNRYWLDVNLAIDLKKVANLSCGGWIKAAYWQTGGDNGTAETGTFNAISSIDADVRKELALLYYENSFTEGKFRTRLGKMDPSVEFNHSEYAGDFLNRAATFSPVQFPMPYFPETAVGAELHYKGKGLYSGIGFFDGSAQEGIHTGKVGARHFFGEPADTFTVAEAGYRWTDGLRPVRAAIGGWVHNGDFATASGRIDNRAAGMYLLAEGMLLKEDMADPKDNRGMYLVGRFSSTAEAVSVVDAPITVAAVWKGTFASRKTDSVGLAWTWADVTGKDGGTIRDPSEQVLELYYKAQLTPFASITPDLQYIINPGGNFGDALILGLRFVIDF